MCYKKMWINISIKYIYIETKSIENNFPLIYMNKNYINSRNFQNATNTSIQLKIIQELEINLNLINSKCDFSNF